MAIVGIDHLQNGNVDEVAETVGLLRSYGKIVLLSETDRRIHPQRVLALPPDAFIFNLGSRDVLIKALELTFQDQRVLVSAKSITTIAKEGVQFTDPVTDLPSDDRHRLGIKGHRLTPREIQILGGLAQGKSNKAIARLHNLSEATVKVHLKAILRKIKAHNRTQAAIWAIQQNMALPK